jgi:hypothetical protein
MSSSDLVSELSTTVGLHLVSINPVLLCAFVPIKIYPNAEADKAIILSDNKNKSGIYRFTNLINGKRYVGSALDLYNRLLFYYSPAKINYALQQGNSYICSAIIKYGLQDFSLEILEYCEPDKLLIREKYYIDLGTEYNIVQDPTIPPMSGRTHSKESKTIMSDAHKKIDHPGRYKPGHKHSDKTRNNIKAAQPTSQQIEVTDIKNNTTTSYDSIREAARALNINQSSISMFLKNNQQKPYKGQYIFKKI